MNKLGLVFLTIGLWLASAQAQPTAKKYWIFFRDKGPAALAKGAEVYRKAAAQLTERAIQRRLKVLPPERLIDEADLDVYPGYLSELKRQGIHPVVVSRWLNGVSAYLTLKQMAAVRALPFVRSVQPVRKLAPPPMPKTPPAKAPKPTKPAVHVYDYGQALTQVSLVNVPPLHDAGIVGEGVIVGMLDTGFNWREHPAFQELKVLGEYDFVFNDSTTADEKDKDLPGAHSHGTATLSVIGGYDPGVLIGPAFRSQFYLSKTEDIRSETPVEEDNWAAGIEWMESQGIDVASSSLGYFSFDDPADNYSYSDLDGKTTVVTRAAQIAAQKGVVVVNSAGNEGFSSWRYIIAPADGDLVIAVGAVDAAGRRVGFSSVGPTADGRIKPDVMAMGTGVWLARASKIDPYGTGSGTSFSCPMVAGVVALMLSAHPNLTPTQVIEALHKTSSRAEFPDTLMGYGIVDAVKAATYWGPAFSNKIEVEFPVVDRVRLAVRVLSDPPIAQNGAFVYWRFAGGGDFQKSAMHFTDSTRLESELLPFDPNQKMELYFAVEVPGKGTFNHPFDVPDRLFVLGDGGDVTPPQFIPEEFTILQNYPNPFAPGTHGSTRFIIGLPDGAEVEAVVYNLLGQKVAVLREPAMAQRGSLVVTWDGQSDSGRPSAAGIYFLRVTFRTHGGTSVIKHKKFTLLRTPQ
ncbi:MAG: S8 family serine peptidase [candidate division KSB1 bacterium]|nr:S8 family serine peptidase [candidate division KSB1 bacterium]MDQ7065191.1 S8 family serine peptidase [candidate division KSB1 bacterium]